jgi:oligopeptide/dipeptide ABC transporter ATP-binding protein
MKRDVTTLQPEVDNTRTSAQSDVLLRVTDLVVHFNAGRRKGKNVIRAIDGVSFEIRRGESLGLIGESGSGKSTVGRTVLGIYKPTSGSVNFDGTEVSTLGRHELRDLRRRLQIVFQDPYSSLDPRMRVGSTIEEPLIAHKVGNADERALRSASLLNDVGLPAQAARSYPHELSGGQRQRVAIARALALQPELIVADEVISALDVSVQAQILSLLKKLKDEHGLAYLFISHDLAVVANICDRILVMYAGKIVEEMSSTDVLADPCHPYTIALMSAVGTPDPEKELLRQRIILSGETPSPITPPSGCRFHPRCWLRASLPDSSRCESEEPALSSIGGGHRVACHFVGEVRSSLERTRALAGLQESDAIGVDVSGESTLGSQLPPPPTDMDTEQ